jgi:ribosomal protein S18 acetylase RimI-like enzyme
VKVAPVIAITRAEAPDAPTILALQKLAYQSEAAIYNDWSIPPLIQSLESLAGEFSQGVVLKAMQGGRIVGSVRARACGATCAIGRLVVHPDCQGQGLGSRLLQAIEEAFPAVSGYELFTGSRSEANIRLYQRHGYAIFRTQVLSPTVSLVFLEKARATRSTGVPG